MADLKQLKMCIDKLNEFGITDETEFYIDVYGSIRFTTNSEYDIIIHEENDAVKITAIKER